MGKNFKKFNRERSEKTNNGGSKSNWMTEERIEEPAVGITEYISNHRGFTGIIKSRFSDFQVNEIDVNNKECVLSDFSIPEPEIFTEPTSTELTELITEDELRQIQELSDSKEAETGNKSVEIDVTEFDKEKRSALHKSIKIKFGRSVFANTVDRDEKKFIQIKKQMAKDTRQAPGKWQYPNEFVHFVLYKENIDTIQAVSSLANKLKMKPALFAYSGTKDKRAKTSQWISVKKVEPTKIRHAAKNCQGVRVGNFQFQAEPLRLGLLNGNRFRIALRSVKGDRDDIENGLKSLRDKGFINYYGLQRFGNCVKVPTFMIGKSLLTENFSEACELILQERVGEPIYMTKMRSVYAETKDAQQALKVLHTTNTCIEARLLRGLVKYPANFLQALITLPRNMLMLYTHAYQSFIWNQVASMRCKLGLNVLEGDLVFTEEPDTKVIVEKPASDDADDDEIDNEEIVESKFLAMVRPLTKDDVDSGKFSIFDIVLPLPGHDIKYPSNLIGEAYTELMSKDNLTSEKLKNKHPVFSLNGAYRKVFHKPQNVSWKFMKYTGQSDLILSDFSRLCGDADPEDDANGESLALIVDFILQPSSYATMALRELMKCDTNVGNHIKMESQIDNKRKLNEDDVANDDEVKKVKIDSDDEVDEVELPSNAVELEKLRETYKIIIDLHENDPVAFDEKYSKLFDHNVYAKFNIDIAKFKNSTFTEENLNDPSYIVFLQTMLKKLAKINTATREGAPSISIA